MPLPKNAQTPKQKPANTFKNETSISHSPFFDDNSSVPVLTMLSKHILAKSFARWRNFTIKIHNLDRISEDYTTYRDKATVSLHLIAWYNFVLANIISRRMLLRRAINGLCYIHRIKQHLKFTAICYIEDRVSKTVRIWHSLTLRKKEDAAFKAKALHTSTIIYSARKTNNLLSRGFLTWQEASKKNRIKKISLAAVASFSRQRLLSFSFNSGKRYPLVKKWKKSVIFK
jgi:hypothetical protein